MFLLEVMLVLYGANLQGYKNCCNKIELDFKKDFGKCLRENKEDFLGN